MRITGHTVLAGHASRTTRLICVLVGLVLSWPGYAVAEGASGRTARSKPADELSLSVMTFNIRYGTAKDGENRWALRKELVFDVVRSRHPDIACLQEALYGQLEEALRALPAYSYVGVGRDDGKRAGEFAPILYVADRFNVAEQGTFWLSATPEKPGSMTWGNRLPRICTWVRLIDRRTGRGLHVYNVHLDHASQPSREQAVVLLAERIRDRSNGEPLILAGDFNAGEDNPAIRFLTGQGTAIARKTLPLPPSPGLADTFRIAHPDATDVGTFHGFRGTTSGSKIDYIFVPPTTRVTSAGILCDRQKGRYPSDHFPVVAELVFDSK
jgi:endonuclease/exonuclease/phosphatase family metal-dependent hydrolase